MDRPLVSIIVPVWNAGETVPRMADTILDQSFENFELILVDDGSTDDTLSILREIEKTDSRVRVFTKPNGGPSSARNLGLEKVNGEYIQFYDADDSVATGALQVIVNAIRKSKGDLLVSGWRIDLQGEKKRVDGYKRISPERELVSNDLRVYILRSLGTNGMLYNLWNKLFRADIIRKYHLRFREDISFGEDLIFALHYFPYISRLQVISDITYHYQESSTGAFGKSALNTRSIQRNSLHSRVKIELQKPAIYFIGLSGDGYFHIGYSSLIATSHIAKRSLVYVKT